VATPLPHAKGVNGKVEDLQRPCPGGEESEAHRSAVPGSEEQLGARKVEAPQYPREGGFAGGPLWLLVSACCCAGPDHRGLHHLVPSLGLGHI
jgi:hypothetical protein